LPPPFDLLPQLWDGFLLTLQLTGGGIGFGIILSFLAGLGKLSKFFPFRWIAICYIEVFRGTSALVQLFWFVLVLPRLGVPIEAMTAGIVVLGLNLGAYGGEIVRGSIQAVPRGQYEAATSLNFTPLQTLWRIIIPQAVVSMIPPMGNIFIELLKATALVSLISLSELTFEAKVIRDDTLRTTEVFTLILFIYFAIALAMTAGMRMLERKASKGMDVGGIKK